jgi:hypothetical protein
MNAPQLDHHGERAARELASRLNHIPPAYLADPYAFALRFIQDLIVEHWRHIPPPLDLISSRRRVDPETAAEVARRGAELVRRELLATREDTDQ